MSLLLRCNAGALPGPLADGSGRTATSPGSTLPGPQARAQPLSADPAPACSPPDKQALLLVLSGAPIVSNIFPEIPGSLPFGSPLGVVRVEVCFARRSFSPCFPP